MGRERKKWPHYAEWARQDAICAFDRDYKFARETQQLIQEGRLLEAVLRLSDLADSATKGKATLQEAKEIKI